MFVRYSKIRGVAVVRPSSAYVDGERVGGGSLPRGIVAVNVQYVYSHRVLFLLFLILGAKNYAS